ncbi:helix-turn-helix transcriptional regulator [Sphingomonas psychrotolerans]|uniref:Helix-turn-helix transcriptional regulator n=1 Tax=Sphingomonas psychrotolerans TaxID=1327635 RepID=A0ABU3MZY5_9SPHN|nr:helix-turn-helix domain-containing protein [Sphingomonas psychrotolerans]MDT8757179.1 helix-turn-helix transcriptional regulator [Sphingomonas psychrotolerans]
MQDDTLISPGHLEGTRNGRGNVYARGCSTRQLLDRIGDKWSVLILLLLGDGEMRFSELKRRIDGVSQKMLTQTLRSLERDGLVDREAVPTVPVTVTYRITPLAGELLAALRLMMEWAETRMSAVAAAQAKFDEQRAAVDQTYPIGQ